MTRALLVLSILTFIGCASLTSEGAKVRVTNNPQATASCKFLGSVKGKFDNDLRNEAAKLGANLVFNMTQHNEIHVWQHGEAYRCEQ